MSVTALVVVGLALTGCGAETKASGPTLASTKSPVQLLRNEAASRIPSGTIDTVAAAEDFSVACNTEEKDPLGLERFWHSNTQVTVERGSSWRIDAVADDLAQSFVDQGWLATAIAGGPRSHIIELSSETSPAIIVVTTNRPDPAAEPVEADTDQPVTIGLEVRGPCVATDGSESDAVKKLEGRV